MARPALVALLLCSVAVGCAADAEPTVVSGPFDPLAELRPDLIVAEPTRVAPGDLVSLTFPQHTLRGVHFVLERQVGGSWDLVYHLTPSVDLRERSFFRPGEEGFEFPAIGITGPGPDRVPIPGDVAPGKYRICTANARDEFCAAIEVAAP